MGGEVQIPARTLLPAGATEPSPPVAWALRAPAAVVLRPARIAGLSAEAAATPPPVVIAPTASTAEAATSARIRIVHPLLLIAAAWRSQRSR